MKKEPNLSVGILVSNEIHFVLKGEFHLNSEPITGNQKASISNDIIKINGQLFSTITLTPSTSASTFILKNVSIGIGFHWEQQINQEFQGSLKFVVEEGKVRAINLIPLESYLSSVISSEMSAMNDMTLLQVHAIVSRSWLLAQIENSKLRKDCFDSAHNDIQHYKHSNEIIKWYDREDHKGFDVCADDHCQRYQGVTRVISKNVAKAIDATRGQILEYKGKICDARFSKCCGGITENFENVWQAVTIPYLTSIVDSDQDISLNEKFYTTPIDAYCNTSDKNILSQIFVDFDQQTNDFFRWTVRYSTKELSELIQLKSGIDIGIIHELIPLERGESGRIIRLKIIGGKKTLIVGKELEIRKWLSESHLYSSAFTVEKTETGFTLNGAGWGHGVGMCQIGAAVMSQKNFSVHQILQHYFKGAEIKKAY